MLQGKIALVTGGTRGIGYAIVKKFLEHGATVILCGSREETAKRAEQQLKAENAAWHVEGIWPDLTDPAQLQAACSDIQARHGRLDILVNNAGISARDSLFDYRPEDFAAIMELNVNSIFYASQAAARIMKEQGGGVILNTSSMVSFYGQSAGAGYPASKFAVNGLTRSLARELGPYGIRVNAVAPGVTRTDMVSALPEDMVQRITAPIPLGRMGEPEEIADAFVFLASSMASYITGAVLSVDGAAQV